MNDATAPNDVKTVYLEACKLVEGLLDFDRPPTPLDDSAQHRLNRATLLFSTVVHFIPTHWPSLWLLGKTAQRLGELEQAFNYFRLASNCNPNHPDVLRETTIASLELGRLQDAVIYGSRAVEIEPGNSGLQANFALALLFSEKIAEAQAVVEQAIKLDPSDGVSKRIGGIIDEVQRGVRPCPHHVRDLKQNRV
jgi:tetratricopeptide (TPR) repeat protein